MAFTLCGLSGVFTPGHEATWEDETITGKLDNEILVVFFNNHTCTAKRRQFAAKEQVEQVEENTGASFK